MSSSNVLPCALGWTHEQWVAALHFYDRPCLTLSDYLNCRLFWWAHWDNPPCAAQLFFVSPRASHRDMAVHLFRDLTPLLDERPGAD